MVPGVTWSRVYLIDAECLALVDSGLPWSASKVLRYIRAIGRDVSDLEYILMTHSHPDHTSGAHAIRQSTGAKVVSHAHDTRRHSEEEVSMDYLGVFGSSKIPLPFLRRTTVDRVVSEPFGGAHRGYDEAAENLKQQILEALAEIRDLPPQELVANRIDKFDALGMWEEK